MNKKTVLVVDEDSYRAEQLVFIVELGGYKTRIFSSEAAALNWAKYGCAEGDVLCFLFNNPGELSRAGQIVAAWRAAGMALPVLMVQRGKESWNRLLAIGQNDQFFVCEPESLMQSLDVLTEITANNRCDTEDGAGRRAAGKGKVSSQGQEPGADEQRTVHWQGALTQAMSMELGGELLNVFEECGTLTVNLDGVQSLDFSCLVLLCAVKRQTSEKGKKFLFAGLNNPVVAAVVQRYHSNGNRLCRTYCGNSCLFDL